MKKSLIVIAAAAAAATLAGAAHAEIFNDRARVVAADPQYENVATPREECTRQIVNQVQPAQVAGERNYGGAVIGGVAGALLGNQVGKGHGREAATAVGAVVGAMAGDNIANRDRPQGYAQGYVEVPREVTTCRTVQDIRPQLTGYRVQYEYKGQVFSTFMREQPGPTMRVRVSVEPG